MLGWFILGAVLFIEFVDLKQKPSYLNQLYGLADAKEWYIPVFLIKNLGILLLISFGFYLFNFKTIIFVIIGVDLVYTIVIILCRPYKRSLCNITILIEQLCTLLSLSLSIIHEYIVISQSLEIVLIFSLLILLSFVTLLTIIRIFMVYR